MFPFLSIPKQLTCMGLLLFLIPWGGCQYIRAVEDILRERQRAELLSLTTVLTNMLVHDSTFLVLADRFGGPDQALYATPITGDIVLDGYEAEWLYRYKIPPLVVANNEGVTYRMAVSGDHLYLLLAIDDNDIAYHQPLDQQLEVADFIRLAVDGIDYVVVAEAPGQFFPQRLVALDGSIRRQREHRIMGIWQETEEGYNVELQIPYRANMSLLFDVVDYDRPTVQEMPAKQLTIESRLRSSSRLGVLTERKVLLPQTELADSLNQINLIRQTVSVFSRSGWLLAKTPNSAQKPKARLVETSGGIDTPVDVDNVIDSSLVVNKEAAVDGNDINIASANRPSQSVSISDLWLGKLFRIVLSEGDVAGEQPRPGALAARQNRLAILPANRANSSDVQWSRNAVGDSARLTLQMPVFVDNKLLGFVVTEQVTDSILSLADAKVVRLFYYGLIVIGAMFLLLFVFAMQLSLRIRKLNRAAQQIIAADGTIIECFAPQRPYDEVGELAQSFYDLQTRLAEYTRYLKSLASKMSHELRTPTAIVKTSLENISQETLSLEMQKYLTRAEQGLSRLNQIVTAMSTVSRIEQFIEQGEKETFDLAVQLRELSTAYQHLYVSRIFVVDIPEQRCDYIGTPDLIAQMMDKLIDNAVGFTPVNGKILIRLFAEKKQYRLLVVNEGPPLPSDSRDQLFDSMVSFRSSHSGAGSNDGDALNKPIHLGLGLHIVRLITQYHEGVVSAENVDSLDGISGVVVTVVLPTL